MVYSNDIKEEVRSRNDIVDVISSYVSLKRSGSNYMGLCPFHSEKSPSFSVSASRQMYHCFGCGASGDVFMFVEQYENYSFVEALKFLAERAGMELPAIEMSPQEKMKASVKQQLFEVQKLAAGYYYYMLHQPQAKNAYDYLTGRGLSEETIKKFGLGYSDAGGQGLYKYLKSKNYSDEILKQAGLFTFDEKKGTYDKFWNRVMFPITNANNKVIAFGGRVMSDAKPKYLNSPETILFDKSRNLFGINYARTSRKNYFIVCEGYMDVISLHQAGFTSAVAPLGTALTPLQAGMIKRYVDTVYISFDSDEAGVKAALRAIPILKNAGLTAKVINLKPYKDPDELIKACGVEEYEKRIEEAIGSFYFETQVESTRYDLKDPEEKMKFIRQVAGKLITFSEEVERNIYCDAVADRYGIDRKEMKRLVNHLGATQISQGSSGKEKMHSKKVKGNDSDSAMKLPQRILLTWLGDDVTLFEKVKKIIEPQDFKDELYNKAAAILYKQYEEEGKATPVRIPGMFEEGGEQEEVARIFTTDLKGELLRNFGQDSDSELTKEIKERAINQIVYRVKMQSIEDTLRSSTDFDVVKKCGQQKKELQNLHITLNAD